MFEILKNLLPIKVLFLLLILISPMGADERVKNCFTYSFVNLSVNYLDWGDATQEKTAQRDFSYLELEGGFGWDGGEFYGFADLKSPTARESGNFIDNLYISLKPVLDIDIYDKVALHIQNYYLSSNDFFVSDWVGGLSYKVSTNNGFWIRPFLGWHYLNTTYYKGMNGYMFGWTLNYNFTLLQESFSIFQWHEIDFDRDKRYYLGDDGSPIGDGTSSGVNGALSFWWHYNMSLQAGLQYRYANNKLGYQEYQSAIIYSIKYYF